MVALISDEQSFGSDTKAVYTKEMDANIDLMMNLSKGVQFIR